MFDLACPTRKGSYSIFSGIFSNIRKGNFDEFLELWIQFGYVTLFTCIYEWAPVCALVATLIEIRNDAHKFCNLLQRIGPNICSIAILAFLD